MKAIHKFIEDQMRRHGFLDGVSTRYQITIHGDGSKSVDRSYRFRWQELRVGMSGHEWAGRLGVRAHFADDDAMRQAITAANRKSETDTWRRVKLSQEYVDQRFLDIPSYIEPGEDETD